MDAAATVSATDERVGQKLADFIRVYDHALAPQLCDDIVARFEADEANRKQVDYNNIRRFAVLDITASPNWRDIHNILFQALVAGVERYGKDCRTRWLPPNQSIENFRIKRYRAGLAEVTSLDATAGVQHAPGTAAYTIKKATGWTAPQIAAAQTVIDGAPGLTAELTAQALVDTLPIIQQAIVLALIDQLNVIRGALPVPLGAITPAQAIAAIRAKAGAL